MPLDSQNRDFPEGSGGHRGAATPAEPEGYSQFGDPAGTPNWFERWVKAPLRRIFGGSGRPAGQAEHDVAEELARRNPAEHFVDGFRRGYPPQQAGWRDGRALEPPAGAAMLSTYELEALTAFQTQSEMIAASIRSDRDTLKDRIDEYVSDPLPLVRGITASVQGKLERQAEDVFPQLRRADDEVVRADGARGEAYAKQGLAASPTPGPTTPWSRIIAVLLSIAFAESFPTWWALRDVVPGGDMTAVFWGLSISGFNVALSFWCGYGIGPLARSTFRAAKISGWSLTVLFVVFIWFWQWGVAAFRYLVRDTDSEPFDVAGRVFAELWRNPLLWCPDLFGWMLFTAGMVFAVSALRKGFDLALTRVDRDYAAALKAERTLKEGFEAACMEIAAKGERDLAAVLAKANSERDQKLGAAAALKRLMRAFYEQHTRLVRGPHGVRRDYWLAQVRTRGGVPLPAHANELLQLEDPMEALNAEVLEAKSEYWSNRTVAADEQVSVARTRITLSVRRVLDGVHERVLRCRGEPLAVPDTGPSDPPPPDATDLGSGAEPIP